MSKMGKKAVVIADKNIAGSEVIDEALEILRGKGYEPVLAGDLSLKKALEAIDSSEFVVVVGNAGNWILGGLLLIARVLGKEIAVYDSTGDWIKIFSARRLT